MKRSKRGPYRVRRHEVVQPLGQSYRFIPLTQGQIAIVDATDFEWLNNWNWIAQYSQFTKSFYAQRRDGDSYALMHRVILACGPDEEGDHKNRNTLDNRRHNLRKATRAQNQANRILLPNNTSGFKGVSWYPNLNKWVAYITANKKRRFLGYFEIKEDAARAHDEAAKKYHGEFAHLNFPTKEQESS